MVAAVLWLTSPTVLGHGPLVMPDAVSVVAMTGILIASLHHLGHRDRQSWFWMGIAWGVAISTKFTFCPLWLIWPVGMGVAAAVVGRGPRPRWRNFASLAAGHYAAGAVAWVVVVITYGGADMGVPVNRLPLASDRMTALTSFAGSLPCPLPGQFIVGIDEQQLDLERGIRTYVLGRWYPEGIWWYSWVGLAIKEQMAMGAALIAAGVSAEFGISRVRRSRRQWASPTTAAILILAAFSVVATLGLLSLHPKHARNVRYAMPATPGLCLIGGWGVAAIGRRHRRIGRGIGVVGGILIAGELVLQFPDYFGYANPLLGGDRRVPPALHGSNFDGGQDLWQLERWARRHPVPARRRRYHAIHGDVPLEAIRLDVVPPPVALLQRAIEQWAIKQRRGGAGIGSVGAIDAEIIVMRGLGVPTPWNRVLGTVDAEVGARLVELLRHPPDRWITSTVVIYDVRGN